MREQPSLTPQDLEWLARLGISATEVQRQLDLFRHPPRPVQLVRPCLLGDGIARITEDQQARYVDRWQSLTRQRRLAKFVPASGAATRMFKDLTSPPAQIESTDPPSAARWTESLQQFSTLR